MKFYYLILMMLVFILGGCSTKQPIVALAKDTYMISVDGFNPQSMQSSAISEANTFCQKSSKHFILDRLDKRIRYDGNGEIDIYFNCVSEGEYKRVQYNKEADLKIDIQNK